MSTRKTLPFLVLSGILSPTKPMTSIANMLLTQVTAITSLYGNAWLASKLQKRAAGKTYS